MSFQMNDPWAGWCVSTNKSMPSIVTVYDVDKGKCFDDSDTTYVQKSTEGQSMVTAQRNLYQKVQSWFVATDMK